MATIYDYLDKKRLDFPEYAHHSNIRLYEILRGRDSNLPRWDALETSMSKQKRPVSSLEQEQNPSFVNGLFNWTDWGIDETDPNWVKNAYNTSITGLSYKLYNKKQKYGIDENWNPGILEDIGSAVLSFMMPMDIGAMFVGGWAGKAGLAATSAAKSVQRSAVKNLVAKGITKEGAEKTVSKLLSNKAWDGTKRGIFAKVTAKSQIAQHAAPKLAGAGLQGGTLATFEGVRGGLEAANNGEDARGIWKGIGKGVAHGGIMGGLAGFVGASLNIKNAKLFAKAEQQGLSTTERISAAVKGDMQQAGLLATGAVGQVAAEATVFTAPDIYNVITDDHYTMKDFFRNYAVNVGMMGILKVKSKLIDKGVKEAREILKDLVNEGKGEKDLFDSAGESIKENMASEVNKAETKPERDSLEGASKTLINTYLKPALEKHNITLEQFNKFEERTRNLIKTIKDYGIGEINPNKLSGTKYANLYRAVKEIKSVLETGIGNHKKNLTGKKAQIERLKDLVEQIENKIEKPLNDYKNAQKVAEPDASEVAYLKTRIGNEIKKAFKEGNKTAIDVLTEGNKEFISIDKKGNVTFEKEAKMGVAKQQLDGYEKAFDIVKKGLEDKGVPKDIVDKISEAKEQLKYKPDTPEFQERINTLEELIRKEKDISKKEPLEEELGLLKASKEIRDKQLSEDKGGENYRQSKTFLHYIAQRVLPTHAPRKQAVDKPGILKRIDNLVKWVAEKRNKNIFELTDKDIKAYFEAGKAKSHAHDWAFLVQQLKNAGMSTAGVGKLKVTTKVTIDALFEGLEILKGKKGPRTIAREVLYGEKGIETYWKFGEDYVQYIQPKKGSLVGTIKKYVTKKLGKVLQKLSKNSEGPDGHNEFLFKDVINHAITNKTLLPFIQHYFKKKSIPKGEAGEHRAFRYSFEQYIVKKYGAGSAEAKEVLKLVLGDTPPKTMIDTYGRKLYNEYQSRAKSLVEEYLTDIDNGYFREKGIEDNPIVKMDREFAKNEAGYNPFEIKEGLKRLESDIKKGKKIKFNGQEISPEVAKAMVDYMIQTAPRINEIVPETSDVTTRIKAVKKMKDSLAKAEIEESKKTQRQVESAEEAISADELVNQIKWQEKKHPDITRKVEKTLGKFNGQYVLGKLVDKVVSLAEGKTRTDTLPHEVAHDTVNVLKAVGDKFSKKLIERGINLFKPEAIKKKDTAYGAYAESIKKDVKKLTSKEKKEAINEYAEELLVDALGKYTANRIKNKTMLSKMKYWVSNVVSYFRQLFGIHNPNDVAKMKADIVNILGEKVFKGKKPTDYMGSAASLKVQYQTAETKSGHKNLNNANASVHITIRDLKQNHNVSDKIIKRIIKDELGIEHWTIKEGKKNSVDANDLWNLRTKLEALVAGRGAGKSDNLSANELSVEKVEKKYKINEAQRDKFFKDTYNTTFKEATGLMIADYRAVVAKGKETPAILTPASDFTAKYSDVKSSLATWKRPFMTVGGVLRRYAGEFGKVIARSLDQHDHVRTLYYGEAQVHLDRIAKIVDKKTRNNYMHLIDKSLAAGARKSLEDLVAKHPKNKQYREELADVKIISEKFATGEYKDARIIWHGKDGKGGLTGGFWNALGKEIAKNTNAQEFKDIMRTLNAKYITNYFTRRVRYEVLQHLDANTPAVVKLAKELVGNLSKKELKEAADRLVKKEKEKAGTGIKKGSEDYNAILEGRGKHLLDIVANEIFDMYKFNPAKVKPNFLKERGEQLPEYIEIMTSKGKKTVKTYETSLDATMTNYALGMSRFLATVRLFPEFTELGGKFSLEKGNKARIIKLMKENEMGLYALDAVERQLGLSHDSADILNSPLLATAGRITNLSAAIGLSSPTSGIKNVLIQIPRTAALFGVRNTMKAITRGLTIYNDPKLYEQAVREGQIGFGTKVIFEESPLVGKKIKWWFDNVNLMMKSENLNRIISAEAAKMHFNELTNKLRGNPSLFHPKAESGEVQRYLKYNYRLTDKQINFIIKEPNLTGNKEFAKIQEWVGFQGHKRAAGATGVADLPLWMSHKYAKPFTLFQRIAMSVTVDSYNNYVKPLANLNIAPMLKATIGHGLAGAALYTMYDSLIGQQPPKEDSPAIDRAISYIWRGEMLGVWGEILSPYQKELSMPIMEPVIIRNGKLAWENISEAIQYKKSWGDAIRDMNLKSIVIIGQGEKIFTQIYHPYVTQYKRVRTLERTFEKENDYGANADWEKTKRSPYYWNLKKAIMLGKSDAEIAKAYYAVYNYLLHDLETREKIVSKSKRIKKAKAAIETSIRLMAPITQSDNKGGRAISRYQEFLNFLSPSNRKMAEDLMKTYHVKVRNLERIKRNSAYFRANVLY